MLPVRATIKPELSTTSWAGAWTLNVSTTAVFWPEVGTVLTRALSALTKAFAGAAVVFTTVTLWDTAV